MLYTIIYTTIILAYHTVLGYINIEKTNELLVQTEYIHVVLGCHIDFIQDDRILTALLFTKNVESTVWFLTGGVKNAINNQLNSESKKMAESFKSMNIVLDEKAKNTAENFVYLHQWIKNQNFLIIPKVVITTSEFHKERASKIFNGILPEFEPIWNLGKKACSYCWADEKIHSNNIFKDIKNALKIL